MGKTASPIAFQVMGDRRVLWSSNNMQAIHKTEDCKVAIRGVRVLELRVFCPGSHDAAHAVWLDPYILSKLSNEEIKKRLR